MLSDEECREVARRLRHARTAHEIGEAVGVNCHGGLCNGCASEAAQLLADLIEPSCNRDALLALADKLKKESWKLQDEFMRTGIERYGYELAIAQQDGWIADCILEACGKYDLNGKE